MFEEIRRLFVAAFFFSAKIRSLSTVLFAVDPFEWLLRPSGGMCKKIEKREKDTSTEIIKKIWMTLIWPFDVQAL